ncbi:MAG: TPR REGION protein, partial [Gammaproteobacteria bacterium]|nr:TPR REGION protein [Gammaproteobacteria bacterium]
PYYLYSLARDKFLQEDYAGALADIQAAISHFDKEHRFYFLQGVIYKALGRQEKANTSFTRALDLTYNQKQLNRYLSKMEKLI